MPLNTTQYAALVSGIDTTFSNIQARFETEILADSLPIIGASFSTVVHPQVERLTTLKTTVINALNSVSPSNRDGTAFANAINSNLNAAAFSGSVSASTDGSGNVVLDFSNVFTNQVTVPVEAAANLGMDGLQTFFTDTPTVDAKLGYDLNFSVGLDGASGDQFYLTTTGGSEVDVEIGVSLAGLSTDVRFGGLDYTATSVDSNAMSMRAAINLNGGGDNKLRVSEQDGAGAFFSSTAVFGGANADIKLVGVDVDGLPAMQMDFNLDWQFDCTAIDSDVPTSNFGSAPVVHANNVGFNAGSAVEGFIRPVLEGMHQYGGPIFDLAEKLATPVPGLGDILKAMHLLPPGTEATIIDVLHFVDPDHVSDSAVAAVKQLASIGRLIDNLGSGGNANIVMGSFSFSGDASGADLRNSAFNLAAANLASQVTGPGVGGTTQLGGVLNTLQNPTTGAGSSLQFPLLQDPNQAFGLVLGKPADLVTFHPTLPTISAGYSQSFPVFPLVNANVGVNASAAFDVAFGYDTSGISSGAPLNGFYLSGASNATFTLEVTAGASVGIAGIAEAGVEGGIRGILNIGVDDPNNDGKLHFNEMQAAASVFSLFSTSGRIEAFFAAFYDTLFGGDSIELGSITLVDFDSAETATQVNPPPPPVFLRIEGDHSLLNTGPSAGQRGAGSTSVADIGESIRISPKIGGTDGELIISSPKLKNTGGGVTHTSLGPDQNITVPAKGFILGFGGAGGDVLRVANSVKNPINFYGGPGADRISGGGGKDILYGDDSNGTPESDVLQGNDGDDVLVGDFERPDGTGARDALHGGKGKDTILGGGGSDDIYGGAGNDVLFGGSTTGNYKAVPGLAIYGDYIYGDDGDDALYGGNGNDVLNGGKGFDFMNGFGGADDFYVSQKTESIISETHENDTIYSTAPSYKLPGDYPKLLLWREFIPEEDRYVDADIDGFGNVYDNHIEGNDGANKIYGDKGADKLYGMLGNDFLDGGLNPANKGDTMEGDYGDDTYVVDSTLDVVKEDEVTDDHDPEYKGPGGNDTVRASITFTLPYAATTLHHAIRIENLILFGSAPIDGTGNEVGNVLSAVENSAPNHLRGLAGSDILSGSKGDTLEGGEDGDTYSVQAKGVIIIEGELGGIDEVFSSIPKFTLPANVENLSLSLTQNYDGTGNELNNSILGGSGDNKIFGLGGDDQLFGDNGRDTLDGGADNDEIDGGDGDDLIIAGAGNDDLFGGDGGDTYRILSSGHSIAEPAGAGEDTVEASVDFTLPTGQEIERLTLTETYLVSGSILDGGGITVIGPAYGEGNEFENRIVGNSLANTLVGRDGVDILSGNGGNDTLDGRDATTPVADFLSGGDGNDLYYVDHPGELILELGGGSGGIDSVRTSVSYTLPLNVENIRLTGDDIEGVGNSQNNVLYSQGNGFNTLRGLAGNDTFFSTGDAVFHGGKGDDTFHVTQFTSVVELAGEGTDTVISGLSWTIGEAQVENLTLSGGSDADGTGNELPNYIKGNSAENRLDGAAGIDTLEGGFGDDDYFLDSSKDSVIERDGEGLDVAYLNYVLLNGKYPTYANVEYHIRPDPSAVINGTPGKDGLGGTAGAQSLFGFGGNDYLDGGEGADMMDGGAGDDIYVIDNPGDQITDSDGIDTIRSFISLNLTAFPSIENLRLRAGAFDGTGNGLDNYILGNTGVNTLAGGDGNDFIDGNIGPDVMHGGSGDDTFVVESEGDSVSDVSGIDTILASYSYSIASLPFIENLSLNVAPATARGGRALASAGSGLTAIGNDNDNIVTGNALNNTLAGRGGSDSLDGGAGDDTLFGMGSERGDLTTDTLTGGLGADRFWITNSNGDLTYDAAGNNDYVRITDFNPAKGDRIVITNATAPGGSALDYILTPITEGEGRSEQKSAALYIDKDHNGSVTTGAGADELIAILEGYALVKNVTTLAGLSKIADIISPSYSAGGALDPGKLVGRGKSVADLVDAISGLGASRAIGTIIGAVEKAPAGRDGVGIFSGGKGPDLIRDDIGGSHIFRGKGGGDLFQTADRVTFGIGERDTATSNGKGNVFMLSDGERNYYDDGNPATGGREDFLQIKKFNPGNGDRILLTGEAGDYHLAASGKRGTVELFHDTNANGILDVGIDGAADELLAVIEVTGGSKSLDIDGMAVFAHF